MTSDAGSSQPASGLRPGQAAAIWGVVAAGWAVFVLPVFFGPVGMALGGFAWWRGERRGRWVIVGAFAAMLVGLAIGLLPDSFISN
jgi:hypothetical protein